MRRHLADPARLLLAAAAVAAASAKICPSMDVRNRPENLEKLRNCTVILGDLRVVLIQNVNDSSAYEKYVMPDLVEIVDHLILWDLRGLTSVRTLFPNLRVIRGRKLFRSQYALALYKMPALMEIGLTNLQHIGRGKVIVMACNNLCYVNTINWKQLGASDLSFPPWDSAECNSQICPKNCGGYCWNNYNCQKPNTNYCAHFMDEDACVTSCPESKLTNYDMMRCMTKKECTSMLKGSWFAFNGTCTNTCPIYYNSDKTHGCIYAGKNYTRICKDTEDTVESEYALEQFYGCTHLHNSLDIHITSNTPIQNELEKYLGNIVSIGGRLKVRGSKAITSLEFFRNLTNVEGKNVENQRDGKNVESEKDAIAIFDNENLQKLWDFSKLTVIRGSILFYENPLLCKPEIEKVIKHQNFSDFNKHIALNTNGYKSICNQKNMIITYKSRNPNNITMQWQDSDSDDTIIGYTVYFMLASEDGTLSFESEDTCKSDSWEGLFVSGNEAQLTGLSPFTKYVYYIKTHRTSTKEQQTPISEFRTASTQPSEPLNLEAEATSDTSILLKWQPPEHRNGHLTHYNIVVHLEEDYLPTIRDRNYCRAPHSFEVKEMPIVSMKPSNNCSCSEVLFSEFISNDLQCTKEDKFHSCAQSLYQHDTFFENVKMVSLNETDEEPRSRSVNNYEVSASKTSHEFVDLQHFSMYIFYVRACNKDDTNKTECGSSVMVSQRTDKKKSADVIDSVSTVVSGKDVTIKWSEPEEFNSALVAYEIEYKRADSEHSKSRFDCISQNQNHKLHTKQYKIQDLSVGRWTVRIHAVSLAGVGKNSEWKSFEIVSEENLAVNILGPVIALIFVLIIFIGAYAWYRRKKSRDNVHLITNINPDYAGPVYVEDQWEIDRNDIELIKDLGHGTFGKVYQGLIKSRNYPCAVKTVTDEASTNVRMDFLNEGSVMKTFSDAAHVVKLLGIVSRGHPPLVIMELMERGDLKQYLWRCREPSQNLTTNEMYRMAAEIADGMAYLTAKKFVHRDLAARNCMVAGDRTVKIGDFGMTRDIYETDYYRKDTVGLLPVRWMAPESLADGVFTSDSDVWSYGIVLWEMATLAQQPYQGLSNEEVLHFVRSGHRLDRPPECSDLLYEVMDACWMWRPSERPTFNDIVNKLVDHVGPDFRLVAFCFSQQGRELALNAGPRVKNPPAMALPEDDYFGHFDASEEEVNLYRRDSSRPNSFLPFSNQRNMSMPYQMSPGSPSSTFLFNSS